MVKGISRQVIVVQSPEPKLFEQAIFILRDNPKTREGITDEALLKEAGVLIRNRADRKKRHVLYGPVWGAAGAGVTALIWLLSALF